MPAFRQITEAHDPDSEIIQNLASVFREARKERLQFLIDIHDEEEDRRFLSGLIAKDQVWVIEVEGRLTGFIAFANGWVNHLYIAPQFQRQGLGTRLLNMAKDSNTTLQLWVFKVNSPAIRFYDQHGFRVVEQTDGAANEAKMPDVRMEWRS